jgi:glycosyltransferase involved in cell wall biosynthesis
MAEPAAIIHLTYREGLSSVFAAQVIRPMSLVQKRGYAVTLAVFAPVGDFIRLRSRQQWQARQAEIAALSNLSLHRLPSPPSRARRLWDDLSLFRRWLHRQYHESGSLILHCRGAQAADIALRASQKDSRIRVIFDCRGVDGSEYLYVRGYTSCDQAPDEVKRIAAERDAIQRYAAHGSHAVICVSKAMRDESIRAWDIQRAKIRVVPCCTDVEHGAAAAIRRDAIRQRLGLQDRFLVGYCGSLAPWQMPMESLAVFKLIAELRSDAHFLAVTPQTERFNAVAEAAGVARNRRTILSVPHLDVVNFLAAADVGLLIRASSLVNRVASPVKFAEYLSCGVPIILSEGIGDCSELVRTANVGLVLDDPASTPAICGSLAKFLADYWREPASLRQRCVAVARQRLHWGSAVGDIADLYASMLARA